MSLTFEIDGATNPVVVRMAGTLTLGPQLTKFTKEIHAVLSAHKPARLIVDLSAIEEVDSSGLGELVVLYTSADRLCLLNPSERVSRVVSATRLTGILHQLPDLESARAWIASSP